jgi:hypothetical protein
VSRKFRSRYNLTRITGTSDEYQYNFLISCSEKKRLQWYGHVKRMPEERKPKLILKCVPAERRKRGRPRKTWMEGVHAAMTARNIEQNQWRNREE